MQEGGGVVVMVAVTVVDEVDVEGDVKVEVGRGGAKAVAKGMRWWAVGMFVWSGRVGMGMWGGMR